MFKNGNSLATINRYQISSNRFLTTGNMISFNKIKGESKL